MRKSVGKSLIIVESPGKIKTIKKILGSNFEVKASMGHVIDLPTRTLGVNKKKNFEPEYEVIPKKDKVIEELKREVEKVENVFLAPDPDREGEAIAWHLARALNLNLDSYNRVTFNSITPKAVSEAIENPTKINIDKVNAQQGRRILDRLVGYELSPLLWRKLQKGLSAGRVQSVAVLLVCQREEEIAKFIKEEYWLIDGIFQKKTAESFKSQLIRFKGKKPKITNSAEAGEIVEACRSLEYKVLKTINREKLKRPPAPFITSTLQQECSRYLNFAPNRTMKVAQKLYEGVEIEKGNVVGLITYMRTDSYRVVPEAIAEAREFIKNNYGKEYVPAKERFFKTKAAAQDAHEAIRPTDIKNTPEKMKAHLTNDEYRLYNMIWKRYVASQSADAVFDSVAVELGNDQVIFKSIGETLKFPGFLTLYDISVEDEKEKKNDEAENDEEGEIFNGRLPKLTEGEVLSMKEIIPEQKFTKEPPRYSTATLIKTLEELKIGRPSTYATIVNTILDRNYVEIKEKKFFATDIGIAASVLLKGYFNDLINVEFTAKMEEELDKIEEGQKDWHEVLSEFYSPFSEKISYADKNLKRLNVMTDCSCEKCKSPMTVVFSEKGRFLACSKYPNCRSTRNIPNDFVIFEKGIFDIKEPKIVINERLTAYEKQNQVVRETAEQTVMGKCEKCGKDMVLKKGPYGEFMACSGYPACRNAKPIKKDIGINCPKDGCAGKIMVRKSKKGRIFYSCTEYPKCDFVSWDRPTGENCPECGSFLIVKVSKKGDKTACSNKECSYKPDEKSDNGEGEDTPKTRKKKSEEVTELSEY